jgi:anaphase-promoting complex subunit 2
MLVQIYRSKDLLVTEYRFILAEKLLTKVDDDFDKEVHTLELLRLGFGESSMHQCEIMVKDTAENRRVNLLIQQKKLNENQPVGESKSDAANE